MENTPPKAGPRDVFLHLLAIITLYAAAAALIGLLFNLINLAYPDPLRGYYFAEGAQNSLRFDISILIIVFPVYLWVSWYLNKGYAAAPERRELWVRRWLVYLTLFISALILIGDLVALVNGLLEGDIATSFLLKVLAVFVVIGGIFWYYLRDMRLKDIAGGARGNRYFAWAAIVLVAAAMVGAFFAVGSPARQRQLRLDSQRVADLQALQYQISSYFASRGSLPAQLEEMRGFQGFSVPRDPETGDSYDYTVQGDRAFRLCADFALPSPEPGTEGPTERYPLPAGIPEGKEQVWSHPARQGCFDIVLEASASETVPPATVKPAS